MCCRWEDLLRSLHVGYDSVRRCVAAELLYRQRAEKLVSEQQALQAQLYGALLPGHGAEADALLAQLERNLSLQRLMLADHWAYCHCAALTPIEVAQVHLACYPCAFHAAPAIYGCLVPPQ